MPWNQQNGGPWGPPSGGANPPPPPPPSNQQPPRNNGPSGPQPPDFDALIRRGREQMREALPSGGRGIAAIVAGLVALWLASGIYVVQADEQGVELVFGAHAGTTDPGLRYNWPAPIGNVERVRVQALNRTEVTGETRSNVPPAARRGAAQQQAAVTAVPLTMLTSDENLVTVQMAVFWRVKDSANFVFNIDDPESTVQRAAESAMREVIGQTKIEPALTSSQAQIGQSVVDILQKLLDEYNAGIQVTDVQIGIVAPREVEAAFQKVQTAQQDRARKRNEAETYQRSIVPVARGAAAQTKQAAEAYKQEVVARAQGEADRFLALLTAYRAKPEVTGERLYIESMEEVLRGSNKLLLDAPQGTLPFLPIDRLMGNAPPRADAAPAGQPRAGMVPGPLPGAPAPSSR